MTQKEMNRCAWAGNNPLMWAYHDEEWGVPVHDDARHFEFLVLDGAQAGLSWEIILKKRENYRKAFHQFDFRKVAKYGVRDLKRLLNDPGIVRNRLKIEGAVKNAKGFLKILEEFGSFDRYIWQFTEGRTIQNRLRSTSEIQSRSIHSDAMSKDLKKRGFTFVGSTICYAYMQAAGMVNDHLVDCFRYPLLSRARNQ